jgi:hypothetical protein
MLCAFDFSPMHAECPSHLVLLGLNTIFGKSHKLWNSHYSVFSLFIPLASKYSPQYPILKYPQAMLFFYSKRTNFTAIQNYRKINNMMYFNIQLIRQQTERQNILIFVAARFPEFNFLSMSSLMQF